MSFFCKEHDLSGAGFCPLCAAPESLTPEAKAVLEAADGMIRAKENGSPGHQGFHGGKSEYAWELELCAAVRDWQATQKPKDYAPEELEPNEHFRFANRLPGRVQLSGKLVMIVNGVEDWRHAWEDEAGRVWSFDQSDRLIPLPHQDTTKEDR